ncbi:teleost multiple tissue opsin 3a isoform X1 [Megalobrama amblycephala]|uniref:teleost multiple tissue opsin 3a isoform X1 n=2 Tax=Xenocypridinae TaxID=2743747 RepID=UPI002013F529|nr:teleost multiple tissue opsin 3a isoform X1 [Megalobrama amblycephala]
MVGCASVRRRDEKSESIRKESHSVNTIYPCIEAAMVVYIWSLNISNKDIPALNQSANVSSGDPLEPHDIPPGLSRTGHTVTAVCLGIILVFGCLNNLFVLLIFARFRSLWTPINLILLNISVSDILVCLFGTPFSFASSLYGKWLLGHHGCKWYGFANSLFGIVSLMSLSILSYERYAALLRPTKADVSDFRRAWLCVAGSWLYSLVWTLPPFLGWSSYGPEGPGTTCSVQWHLRSTNSMSYVMCLFIFCLLLPLMLMIFCYGKILFIIKGVTKINLLTAQRRENHILLMVVTMVSCYLLCWMPYGVVALLAAFGRRGLITPVTSVVPSVLAKSSTVVNPVIYVLFNNQFYRCFLAFLKCQEEPSIHGQNPQHSSKEDPHALRPCDGPSLHRNIKGPQNKEQHTLSLVVHYTP